MANDFNTTLGLRPGDEPGTLVLDPRPEHQVAPDVIHFAVLTTVAEISAATAVGAPVVPATVTVHLLSRARLAPLVGKGRVLRKGKRLAVAEGEVTQHGERWWPRPSCSSPSSAEPRQSRSRSGKLPPGGARWAVWAYPV